jgi:hypothetical protein
MKKTNQKPIEYDIHLKYQCSKCDQNHWISYLEASTKNFKIVCCCGKIIKIIRVKSFHLEYEEQKVSLSSVNEKEKLDILSKAAKILVSYGYTEKQADELVIESYKENNTEDYASLVKQILESMRKQNV